MWAVSLSHLNCASGSLSADSSYNLLFTFTTLRHLFIVSNEVRESLLRAVSQLLGCGEKAARILGIFSWPHSRIVRKWMPIFRWSRASAVLNKSYNSLTNIKFSAADPLLRLSYGTSYSTNILSALRIEGLGMPLCKESFLYGLLRTIDLFRPMPTIFPRASTSTLPFSNALGAPQDSINW